MKSLTTLKLHCASLLLLLAGCSRSHLQLDAQVEGLLAKLQLEHYRGAFAENEISFAQVGRLDDAALRDIGVTAMGARLKILDHTANPEVMRKLETGEGSGVSGQGQGSEGQGQGSGISETGEIHERHLTWSDWSQDRSKWLAASVLILFSLPLKFLFLPELREEQKEQVKFCGLPWKFQSASRFACKILLDLLVKMFKGIGRMKKASITPESDSITVRDPILESEYSYTHQDRSGVGVANSTLTRHRFESQRRQHQESEKPPTQFSIQVGTLDNVSRLQVQELAQ
jgi:hypothetical protein